MDERIDLNMKVTLSLTEVAEVLGVSRPIVNRLVHQEDFPSFRIGKRIVVPKKALERWANEQINKS